MYRSCKRDPYIWTVALECDIAINVDRMLYSLRQHIFQLDSRRFIAAEEYLIDVKDDETIIEQPSPFSIARSAPYDSSYSVTDVRYNDFQ